MKKRSWYFAMSLFAAVLLIGCSNQEEQEAQSDPDPYLEVKEAAWNYVKEHDWDKTAAEDWQNADVKEIVADERYELFDATYEGEEVLRVGFKEKGNVTAGTPLILLDPDTLEVIGYIPGE